MKSVVTGGGGFLGRHIVEALLERGDEVVVIARNHYPELENARVTQFPCDVRDRGGLTQAFRGAERVFHTAAKVGIWGRWRDFYETNVTGTENVLRACEENGIEKLIFTSSPSVVFDESDQRGINESAPYPKRYLSHYPHTKKLAEERVLGSNGRHGLYTIALRPHLIWGRGDKFLIPRILEQGKRQKLIRVGDGTNRVDIVHVRNAAEAHLCAAERLGHGANCAGRAYFISQGEPVVLWDFVAELLNRAKLPPVKKSISFRNAYRAGASLETAHKLFARGREPRMTRFLAHQLAKDHFYDITAARNDLGYSPTVTTEQGLRDLFAD